MSLRNPQVESAARELLRRERARQSLHSFALSVDIPLAPEPAMEGLDEDLLGPARCFMPEHIALILDVAQRTVTRPFGRALIMAPPGSAKSAYCSQVVPAWVMGRAPRSRLIGTSYSSQTIERMSRRTQSICRSEHYRNIFGDDLKLTRDAASDWSLSNESEYICAGILAGLTSNRANGIIIDDPVAGRQEADSPVTRQATVNAYSADLLTRLIPGGWILAIMTRWHEDDLMGSILPEDYAGESGMILCRDGMYWEVLNLQAKCERDDDPLGRAKGEYLWPEWFPPKHWEQFEGGRSKEAQRTWSSLYQQRPTPQGSEEWKREWFRWEDPAQWPPDHMLNKAIITDWAVTASQTADFTELFCWGVDSNGEVYLLDTWSGQVATDKSIDALLTMAARNGARRAFDEKGVISNSIAPWLNKAMRRRQIFLHMEPIASTADKIARVQSFQGMAAAGIVHLPDRGPSHAAALQMVDQLIALPAGRHDDKADVAGLLGRVIDKIRHGAAPPAEREPGIKPFTAAWIELDDSPKAAVRYR